MGRSRQPKDVRALDTCFRLMQPGEKYSAGRLVDMLIADGWRYSPPSGRELASWIRRDRLKRFRKVTDLNNLNSYIRR